MTQAITPYESVIIDEPSCGQSSTLAATFIFAHGQERIKPIHSCRRLPRVWPLKGFAWCVLIFLIWLNVSKMANVVRRIARLSYSKLTRK